MTQALETAFAVASKLPQAEQDKIAAWLLEELRDERTWDDKFAKSQDRLSKLADEALAEVAAGRAGEFDPSSL